MACEGWPNLLLGCNHHALPHLVRHVLHVWLSAEGKDIGPGTKAKDQPSQASTTIFTLVTWAQSSSSRWRQGRGWGAAAMACYVISTLVLILQVLTCTSWYYTKVYCTKGENFVKYQNTRFRDPMALLSMDTSVEKIFGDGCIRPICINTMVARPIV